MADPTDIPSEEKLLELTNTANLKYALTNYNDAAELYSKATEMQSALRDEMAPENAELLYLYGRCLYKLAVQHSDVLGNQVTSAEKKKAVPGQELAEDVLETVVEEKSEGVEKKDAPEANQPYFQLVDAEWSDEEDDEPEAEGDGALEVEDDFATAYEILDYARVLLLRQVETQQEADQSASTSKGKGKAVAGEMSAMLRHIKERLADTYDLQAEISLENENFGEAIKDSKAAATWKDELYPKASSLIAEAHYKLSLALEFESMSAIRAAQAKEGEPDAVAPVEQPQANEELRGEAAEEMEIAIESCKLRLAEEMASLGSLEGTAAKAKEEEISEVKEIIDEMEQRLVELRNPVVTLQAPAGVPAKGDPMAGLFASMIGETMAQQKSRIEDASKNANDISGLVRKKKPKTEASSGAANGKRKLEETLGVDEDVKRAKTEE